MEWNSLLLHECYGIILILFIIKFHPDECNGLGQIGQVLFVPIPHCLWASDVNDGQHVPQTGSILPPSADRGWTTSHQIQR